MGFFVPVSTTSAARSKRAVHVPIATMQKMGCKACPKHADRDLVHPVMEPNGPMSADVLVLHAAPRTADDSQGGCGHSEAQSFIARLLRYYLKGDPFIQHAIIQCAVTDKDGEDTKPDQPEVECCRGYIESTIARAKPRIIIGVGDAPLAWIGGVKNGKGSQITAPDARGELIACKIGGHECWYMPVMYPNFLKNRRAGSRKSEFELALEHDLKRAVVLVSNPDFVPPQVITDGYDEGIEVILGDKPSDIDRIEQFLLWAAQQLESGLDYETNGIRPHLIRGTDGKGNALLLTAAVGTFDRVMAFPVMHPAGWPSEHQRKRVMSALGQYLLTANRILCHNAAFEMEWTCYFYGDWPLRFHPWADTMAMAHSMNERRGILSLGCQTRFVFGFNVKDLSNVDTANIINYPLPKVLLYNGMDTKWTCGLAEAQRADLYRPGMEWAVTEYERKMRLAPTLVTTTAKGFPITLSVVAKQEAELEAKQLKIVADFQKLPEVLAYKQRFGAISLTNNQHILTLMKTICQRPEVKKENWDGTVQYTTGDEVLSIIPENEVPSAAMTLLHRGNEKLLSTYLRPMVSRKVVCDDNMVRTSYSSMVAVTGRLASEDPNLQNVPIRTAEGKRVREAFIAPRLHEILKADYGQIEARVIGMLSEDPNLHRYQWTDYDIHGFWAKRIVDLYPKVKDWVVKSVGVDWDEGGMKALRQEAKNKWVFPKFFGAMSNSCADDMHLPYNITDELEGEFWHEFGGVLKWQERLKSGYEKNLYVETRNGRRRSGPMTVNQLINAPVQGTAMDIVGEAMCELSEHAFITQRPEFQPNLMIHDDLTTITKTEGFEEFAEEYAKIMCRPRFDWIIVPLIVEISRGKDWAHTKKYKDFKSDELYGLKNPYK